ncbi:MAG: family 10 glycosylhydrolase [Ignavibacteriales bacterium]|nr:family 10 glycosylhydrolase [Ignavibacteriales bacterium]
MANKRVVKIVIVLLIVISGCTALKLNQSENTLPNTPKVEREFRGAWIATVANINWPSRKDLTTEEQKKEAISILDKLKNDHFNSVIFQARPQCDALYKSDIEPWSYYLTGKQGKAPDPYYDPLEFWIDEAHKRGLELHVWLNPYRAHHIEGGEVTEFSIVQRHPDWVVKLKSGYWWLDPSKKEVQDHSYNVVMDITRRYDLDGIHFDDYFYPYPSYNNDEDFPDEESWKDYSTNGGNLSKADWRRKNINVFIQRVYKGIKEIKPNVKFGLSPFGIWRPKHPESIEGFDQYDKLYADAKLWINEGWVDYWAPQLYWKISTIPQSFPILLEWWKNENLKGRHFWPGINIDRDNNELNTLEVINQIMTIRGMLPDSPGNLCWSVAPILNYKELSDAIVNGPYKKQALVPKTSWFKNTPLSSPEITTSKEIDKIKITWTHENKNKVFRWVVYFKYGNRWDYIILNSDAFSYEVPLTSEYKFINDNDKEVVKKYELNEVAVSAVDRISNESIPAVRKIE